MKVYVSHSKSFDFKKELYEVLEHANLNVEFILPHKESDASYNSEDLIKNKKCDLILAEVSYPATGQGIELGWANSCGIPIVCIYRAGFKIASSLKVITNDFIEYEDAKDLIQKLSTSAAFEPFNRS